MADWQQALDILSDAPQLPPGDASAQQSTRLLHALDAKLRATTAVSAHARDKKLESVTASLARLGVAQKQAAVDEVFRHFSALNGGQKAIEDAHRPLPAGSALWADPALHGQIVRFLTTIEAVTDAAGERVGAVDWAAGFQPERKVVEARYAEAAEAYNSLNESFKKMCAARDGMIGVERKYGVGGDEDVDKEKGEGSEEESSFEEEQNSEADVREESQVGEENDEENEVNEKNAEEGEGEEKVEVEEHQAEESKVEDENGR